MIDRRPSIAGHRTLAPVVCVSAFLCFCVSALAQSGGGYVIKKSAVASGGATVTGGNYQLSGTAGQPDAGDPTGGNYVLTGGLWGPALAGPPPPLPFWDCGDLGSNTCVARTRALTFKIPPPVVATGAGMAIKVTIDDLQNPVPPNDVCCPPPDFSAFESATCTAAGEMNSCARWVGAPYTYLEAQELPDRGNYRASRLQCSPFYYDWGSEPNGGEVNVVGAEILPSSTYTVALYTDNCKGIEDTCAVFSSNVIKTRRAGDIAPVFQSPTGSRTHPNAIDIVGVVNNFKKAIGAPKHVEVQVQPNLPNLNKDADALDIQAVVYNVHLRAYQFSGPCPCPSTVTCNATMCTSDTQCSGGMCTRTCAAGGPRAGEACTSDKHCGVCTGGTSPGLPCANNGQCLGGGTCTTGTCNTQGFCRDRCGRCN